MAVAAVLDGMPARAAVDPATRLLGSYDSGRPGPLLLVTAGLHGNEPAGLRAVEAVLRQLRSSRPPIAWRVAAFAGNMAAIRENKRYIDRDLNRLWHSDIVEGLRNGAISPTETAEHAELAELVDLLFAEADNATGSVHLLDLHTFSAPGYPFCCIGDTLQNRRFARAMPLTTILGLEEQLDGTSMEYLNERGFTTLIVEGGQHEDPRAAGVLEATFWYALVAAGCLRRQDAPGLAAHLRHLRDARGGLPYVLEVRYRHAIRPVDGFAMRPGYTNFQPIKKSEHLADDSGGAVRAPFTGYILMPLYQKLGDDGFFATKPVGNAWLALSQFLRRLELWRFLHLLPGVRRDPGSANSLLVDRGVARWSAGRIFRLFGYRKIRALDDHTLRVTRRRNDLRWERD
ncbi:MAG: succinylglutamate desuccinylase/aspartoacylase family protein [Candidatus Sumerlaeia bacterium]|nr:succinylglutamate desuccinylase/aspartoacylase family protein [Candidatus Sumerlaeia bacterium]